MAIPVPMVMKMVSYAVFDGDDTTWSDDGFGAYKYLIFAVSADDADFGHDDCYVGVNEADGYGGEVLSLVSWW